jgi:hypothetical protein
LLFRERIPDRINSFFGPIRDDIEYAGFLRAVLNNRRRTRREKGRRLPKYRSQKVERSFVDICNSSGGRRSWLRGLSKINKRYALATASTPPTTRFPKNRFFNGLFWEG